MRANYLLWVILTVFYAIVTAGYYLWWTLTYTGWEPIGESEMGFFAPWSWWPFFAGLSAAMVFASLAIGWWIFYISVPLGILSIVGYVFEHSRGQYAH
jgi:hypothetical protein